MEATAEIILPLIDIPVNVIKSPTPRPTVTEVPVFHDLKPKEDSFSTPTREVPTDTFDLELRALLRKHKDWKITSGDDNEYVLTRVRDSPLEESSDGMSSYSESSYDDVDDSKDVSEEMAPITTLFLQFKNFKGRVTTYDLLEYLNAEETVGLSDLELKKLFRARMKDIKGNVWVQFNLI